MSHELSTESGRVEMFYAGKTPWHGLGQAGDVSTPGKALESAGMLWTVETTPGYVQTPGGFDVAEGYRFIRRTDTGRVLGIATPRYKPVQNTQAAEIVDALVSEGQATIETCGALGHGERCWMLSHTPGTFEVVKDDAIVPYVLLAWGHSGKHGIAAKRTFTRVVCKNTLQAAGFGNGKWAEAAAVYMRHSGDISIRIDEARDALGLMRKVTEQTAEAYRALAATPMTAEDMVRYFRSIFPDPETIEADATEAEQIAYNTQKIAWSERMMDLAREIEEGPGHEFASGSAWQAYNAVGHYLDHTYPILKSGGISRARQESALFGANAETKARALTTALALV